MINPNELAMPMTEHIYNGNDIIHYGLTKREYMATKIMAGMMANSTLDATLEWKAKYAVKATDHLINQLNKES